MVEDHWVKGSSSSGPLMRRDGCHSYAGKCFDNQRRLDRGRKVDAIVTLEDSAERISRRHGVAKGAWFWAAALPRALSRGRQQEDVRPVIFSRHATQILTRSWYSVLFRDD